MWVGIGGWICKWVRWRYSWILGRGVWLDRGGDVILLLIPFIIIYQKLPMGFICPLVLTAPNTFYDPACTLPLQLLGRERAISIE